MSWLPSETSGDGNADLYTSYILHVTIPRSSQSYRISRRYSAFHALYTQLKAAVTLDVFRGVCQASPFPDDRFSTWLTGSFATESKKNERTRKISDWLLNILLSPVVMTNASASDLIVEFLEAKGSLSVLTDQQLTWTDGLHSTNISGAPGVSNRYQAAASRRSTLF